MALIFPREGDLQVLTELLSSGENWSLRLFNSNITPAETDTAATYTAHEAAFTGYAAKPLTRSVGSSTWNTPVLQAPSGTPAWSSRTQVAHSQYGSTPQTWTCGATGDTVYGYFITGVSSGKLICAESFNVPRNMTSGDTISITPIYEAA